MAVLGRKAGEIQAVATEELGSSWSLVTAAQFLTGKRARGAIDSFPGDLELDGFNKVKTVALIAAAHELCANGLDHTTISDGQKVRLFLKDSPLTDKEKVLSLLDKQN